MIFKKEREGEKKSRKEGGRNRVEGKKERKKERKEEKKKIDITLHVQLLSGHDIYHFNQILDQFKITVPTES